MSGVLALMPLRNFSGPESVNLAFVRCIGQEQLLSALIFKTMLIELAVLIEDMRME